MAIGEWKNRGRKREMVGKGENSVDEMRRGDGVRR